MLPTFAFNGYSLLFENMDEETADNIGNIIWDGIETWDNRVNLQKLRVHKNYTKQQYEITIWFYVENISEDIEELYLVLKQQ
jgi:phage baseplate assembly protein W